MSVVAGLLAQAQITDQERTEILDTEQGEPLFVLQAGEKLFSYAPENGWYKVRKQVVVRLQDIEDKLINPGVTLRNTDGDSIGYTVKEFKVKEVEKRKVLRSDDVYDAILEGYIFKTKLERNSVPEEALTKILAMRNRTDQQEEFKALREKFDFEEEKFDDFTAYVYREQEKTIADEKDFRIIMIYRNGSTPYAVITNGHTVEVPKFKKEWEEDDFKIIYYYKPTASQEESIQNILYNFLAL